MTGPPSKGGSFVFEYLDGQTSLFSIHFLILDSASGSSPEHLTSHLPTNTQGGSSMRVSIAFVLHLLSLGILTATLLGGFILDRRLRKEPDLHLKLFTAGIAKTIGILSPLVAILLLLTGIANIHNRFLGSTSDWYAEGWLVAKIILYVVMVFNGMFYGPGLMRSRLKLIRSQSEQTAPKDAETSIRSLNKQITLFYAVQTLLFIIIVYLSVFGTAKHPGVI
jgi:hypothetical protein